jgi:DeoR family transcriptional regulator, fructose operon transcriptional repressor
MEKQKREPLFAEERKSKILDLLKQNAKLVVPDLCQYFFVSPATIRNDLRELENAGLLKRTHGGAINSEKTGYELNSYQKEIENLPEKKAIAKFAADMIEDGDTIALDTGTTTLELAKLLAGKKQITVVTNDLFIASYLEENSDANIILIGGSVRKNFHCTIGPIALKTFSGLSVDKVFVATNGITIQKGLTTPDINQAEIKKAMIRMASEIIVLCDSSKIGNHGFVQVCPIAAIHCLVTDGRIDERDLNELVSAGVTVHAVKI